MPGAWSSFHAETIIAAASHRSRSALRPSTAPMREHSNVLGGSSPPNRPSFAALLDGVGSWSALQLARIEAHGVSLLRARSTCMTRGSAQRRTAPIRARGAEIDHASHLPRATKHAEKQTLLVRARVTSHDRLKCRLLCISDRLSRSDFADGAVQEEGQGRTGGQQQRRKEMQGWSFLSVVTHRVPTHPFCFSNCLTLRPGTCPERRSKRLQFGSGAQRTGGPKL